MIIQLPQLFNTILQKIEKLHRDFKSFKQEAEEKSELCRYIGQWLKIMVLIKNAVEAEREGNWNLHVSVVEDSMSVFAELDCGNYLRYGSWYCERIKTLEFTHPQLYRRFSPGQWTVQDSPG